MVKFRPVLYQNKIGSILKRARMTLGLKEEDVLKVLRQRWPSLTLQQYKRFERSSAAGNVGQNLNVDQYLLLCNLLVISANPAFGYRREVHLNQVQEMIEGGKFVFPINTKLRNSIKRLRIEELGYTLKKKELL